MSCGLRPHEAGEGKQRRLVAEEVIEDAGKECGVFRRLAHVRRGDACQRDEAVQLGVVGRNELQPFNRHHFGFISGHEQVSAAIFDWHCGAPRGGCRGWPRLRFVNTL